MSEQPSIEQVKCLIKSQPIFIASKSYCPYCNSAKGTIEVITKDAYYLELDKLQNGAAIQAALFELTGQDYVPNIFFKGEHIGGNDEIQALNASDQLEPKINDAFRSGA